MGLPEIKEAIAKLSPEERRELVRSLVPVRKTLSPSQKSEIQALADAVPANDWVSWEDLKKEFQ